MKSSDLKLIGSPFAPDRKIKLSGEVLAGGQPRVLWLLFSSRENPSTGPHRYSVGPARIGAKCSPPVNGARRYMGRRRRLANSPRARRPRRFGRRGSREATGTDYARKPRRRRLRVHEGPAIVEFPRAESTGGKSFGGQQADLSARRRPTAPGTAQGLASPDPVRKRVAQRGQGAGADPAGRARRHFGASGRVRPVATG